MTETSEHWKRLELEGDLEDSHEHERQLLKALDEMERERDMYRLIANVARNDEKRLTERMEQALKALWKDGHAGRFGYLRSIGGLIRRGFARYNLSKCEYEVTDEGRALAEALHETLELALNRAAEKREKQARRARELDRGEIPKMGPECFGGSDY